MTREGVRHRRLAAFPTQLRALIDPPEVVQALLRRLRDRSGGGGAVHFAAMLMYLHGKADSAFDMAQRPSASSPIGSGLGRRGA